MQTAYLVIVDPESVDGSVNVGYDHRFREVRRTLIDYRVALSLIDEFVSLPAGGGDLCFDPVFVVELRDNDSVHWAGAACFDCGTYYSTDGRGPDGGCFDQTSDDAMQLLDKMRRLVTEKT